MNYKFPVIHTIDDILPHIEGRSEFIVAEREHYTVINYAVAFADTFHMDGPDDLGGAIRRECRGLIFSNNSGRIISRPFHKFFNINERDETQVKELDFSASHTIMEKMDGSMVRPIMIGDTVYLATKMGITDIAEEAAKLLDGWGAAWLRMMCDTGKTPILEYVSPTNKIVVDYKEAKLVLLALRDNVTGEYLDLDLYIENTGPFEVCPIFGTVGDSIDEYIDRVRAKQNCEGDIIRWADGHMVKCKNEWYVRIHKTKDLIRYDRHIADFIVNEALDDIVGFLDETDLKRVRDFEKEFWDRIWKKSIAIGELIDGAYKVYDGDKKRIALEMKPHVDPRDMPFIFKGVGDSGYDIAHALLETVKKSLSSNVKFDETYEWMNKNE